MYVREHSAKGSPSRRRQEARKKGVDPFYGTKGGDLKRKLLSPVKGREGEKV